MLRGVELSINEFIDFCTLFIVIDVETFLVSQKVQKHPVNTTHLHIVPPVDGYRHLLRLLDVMPPPGWEIQSFAWPQTNPDRRY